MANAAAAMPSAAPAVPQWGNHRSRDLENYLRDWEPRNKNERVIMFCLNVRELLIKRLRTEKDYTVANVCTDYKNLKSNFIREDVLKFSILVRSQPPNVQIILIKHWIDLKNSDIDH